MLERRTDLPIGAGDIEPGCERNATAVKTGDRAEIRESDLGDTERSASPRFGYRAVTPTPGLDDRAVTPAVSKTLEIGIVVLFVGLLTTLLLGAVVPEYRSAADARLGERVLATAGGAIEDAAPPSGVAVESSQRVELPPRIGGAEYALRFDGRWLVLDHPDPQVSGRSELVLPDRIDRVGGEWHSGSDAVVYVRGDRHGAVVELGEGES